MRFVLSGLSITLLASLPCWAEDVVLSEKDLVSVLPSVWTVPELVLPEPDRDQPILGSTASQDGTRLLRHLSGSKEINGFSGILYENRDRDHSTLDPDVFPQLSRIEYAVDLVASGFDFGLAGRIILPAVVLGNSSTAMRGGPVPRSLPRLAMTHPAWRRLTPIPYANNHIYVYPEHRDYDAEDLFPVNWPYMIISQGSSGSDREFLGAVAMTLAAFPAETFAALRDQRLIAPTIQMILRRNLVSVSSREDYLSGRAHPPVFDGNDIQSGRMVADASDMRPEDVPPLMRLRVTQDNFSTVAGLAGLGERLLDTPAAIGRLWRGFAWERTLIVTAEDTVVPDGQELTFEWRLLRGDPARVAIEPLGADGRRAQIRVAWHDPWTETVTQGQRSFERRLSRVDIGVFANNGVYDSAPALISIDFPEHQLRQYAEGPDGMRLVSIDYDAQGRKAYFDPLLYWSAPWTDTARYDDTGTLLGWERRRTDGATSFVPLDEDLVSAENPLVDASNPEVSVLRSPKE